MQQIRRITQQSVKFVVDPFVELGQRLASPKGLVMTVFEGSPALASTGRGRGTLEGSVVQLNEGVLYDCDQSGHSQRGGFSRPVQG